MKLHDLRPAEGATQKRKRVGRGTGSGKGKTAGRGTKGQNSRTGGGVRPTFEGGQLPLVKRLPKLRGFSNRFKVSYNPVNLDSIERLFEAGADVNPDSLTLAGLLRGAEEPVVILGRGELAKAVTVKAHRVSAGAKAKIEAAGGSVEVLPLEINKNFPRS
ncbi:MAG: 50S ribosomal protein L15 [Caldilineaceae bacterium]|nr:50S ribosomal protein L15 [Caldilineaceae bacterium]MBP8109060.1 50S ribosomal protein L15 [Caldilineaceae bacterium]MBP8122043.1 50S ribosomal protein L15 [Caldilineaceae bacterium]